MNGQPAKPSETPIGELVGERWVINLARREDRRALFLIRNGRWGDFNFWRATDAEDPGWTKPSWAVERTRPHHAALSPAEMATANSHKRLWEHGICEDLDYLMVFEDDVVITMEPGLVRVPADADLVLIEDSVHRDDNGEVTGRSHGAFGYVVTRKGMRKLLECTAQLDMPVDMVFLAYAESQIQSDFLWSVDRPFQESAPTLRVYVGPNVATHDYAFTSDLGHDVGDTP